MRSRVQDKEVQSYFLNPGTAGPSWHGVGMNVSLSFWKRYRNGQMQLPLINSGFAYNRKDIKDIDLFSSVL